MNDIVRPSARGLFNDDLESLFESFFRPVRGTAPEGGKGLVPPVDVIEKDNEFVVSVELPGVAKEDIDVTVHNGMLTINAESKSDLGTEQARVIRQERRFGKYVRSMRLGTDIDETRVKASVRDGILELVLPKAEEVKPKKIDVEVG
jgi:HSP20 family protein